MKSNCTRRDFIRTAATGTLAVGAFAAKGPAVYAAQTSKLAVLGGAPVHTGGWPGWPSWDKNWEPELLEVLRSGHWWRGAGNHVERFEKAYAELLGAQRCLATASGTTALMVALHVMGVDAGDEVIVSPFTFIATYNAVLDLKALPVFADTDPATFTLDPTTIESRVTERTRALLPVHIYGLPCDMGPINAIAGKHRLGVVEDACQAWLAEYKGRKCGILGDLGCFSFQNSKHLPSGEGGAITGDSHELLDRCHSYHNCGRAYGSSKGSAPYFTRGSNFRMQQFQAVMLLQQFEKLERETTWRQENADYLAKSLERILGIKPARLPQNSRPIWHLFPFRYDSKQFNDLSRDNFIKALNAEGIPCGGGYDEQYFDGLLDEAIGSRGFKRLFSAQRLKAYRESLQELKGNKETCTTTVAMTQNILLAPRSHMDHIAEAVSRIQQSSAELARRG